MTRYEREFEGISSDAIPAEGQDPNFRDGYHGMRMTGGNGQAAYGAHRLLRRDDLESMGGYTGIHGPDGSTPDEDRRRDERGGGGVHRLDDPEFLRDFDSRGIRYSDEDRPPRG